MSTASPYENGQPPASQQPERAADGYPFRKLLISVFMFAMLWLTFWAALFVAIAQFVLRIFDAGASQDLRHFGGRLGVYMGQLVAYMTFARDEAPFPFASFPSN